MFGRSSSAIARPLLMLAAALVLTGCPTPPKPAPRITALDSGMVTRDEPPPQIAAPEAPTTPVPSVAEPVQSSAPEKNLQLPEGKLPLSAWAQLCGFTQVRSVPNSNPPIVDLRSREGNLTVFLGQRFAKWNGILIGLGFPLVLERGQLMAHSIDVIKNFYPLTAGTLDLPKKRRILVIDAGHGGADPGSPASLRKAWEKELTLDWALRVERMLANTSWRVVLTRRDDRDVSLLDRVAISEANQADLFISLHFNALEVNGNGQGQEESGIETYCLTPVGAPSNTTRNFEDDARHVYPNNEYDAQNLLLACRLQSSLIATTHRRDRGVRRARFMTVVREQKRPAVLIEGGFLSNPNEAALLLRPEFREQMARAVCQALPN